MYVFISEFHFGATMRLILEKSRLLQRFSPRTGYLMRGRVDQSAHQGSPKLPMGSLPGVTDNLKIHMIFKTLTGLVNGDVMRSRDPSI